MGLRCEGTRSWLQHGRREVTLYSLGTQYSHLKPIDVALIDGQNSRSAEKLYIKVTNIRTVKAALLLKQSKNNLTMLQDMECQIGRALKASKKVRIVEVVALSSARFRAIASRAQGALPARRLGHRIGRTKMPVEDGFVASFQVRHFVQVE